MALAYTPQNDPASHLTSASHLHQAAPVFAPTMVPPVSFDPYQTGSRASGRPLPAGAYVRRQAIVVVGLVLAAYMLWLCIGLAGSWLVTTAGASDDFSPAPAMTHVVEPGDTLWSIAGSMDTNRDVRDVVAALADSNGGAALQPGQILNLRPAYK